jgi:hypothetical protein
MDASWRKLAHAQAAHDLDILRGLEVPYQGSPAWFLAGWEVLVGVAGGARS